MIHNFKNKTPTISESAFIADSAEIIGDVEVNDFSSIWFNAVIRGDRSSIKIGSKTSIQDNAVIHSDPEDIVDIGDNVTVGHGAILHGCKIGNNVIIGMNATVLDATEIGNNSIVGANALVPPGKKFPENSLILGIPATVTRELNEQDIEKITNAAKVYVELAKEYEIKT